MYDTVVAECPECGGSFIWQSKGGPCTMETFSVENAPLEVLTVARDGRCVSKQCDVKGYVRIKFEADVEWEKG